MYKPDFTASAIEHWRLKTLEESTLSVRCRADSCVFASFPSGTDEVVASTVRPWKWLRTKIFFILVSVAYLANSKALEDSVHYSSLLGIPVKKETWEVTGCLFCRQSYRITERLIQNLINTELEAKDMIANTQPGFMERKPCQRNQLSLIIIQWLLV